MLWFTASRRHVLLGMSQLSPKWVKFTPNETLPGLFQIRLQYILAHRAKMYWNLFWKNPGCIPFGANLAHFGPKSVKPMFIPYGFFPVSVYCLCAWVLLVWVQSVGIFVSPNWSTSMRAQDKTQGGPVLISPLGKVMRVGLKSRPGSVHSLRNVTRLRL